MRIHFLTAGALALGTLGAANLTNRPKFYNDDPVWTMPRPAPVVTAQPRKLSDYYDFFENSFSDPGEHASKSGEPLPSQAINTVDEVSDSAWYTNRHTTRRMSADELRAGTGNTHAPAPGAWTAVAAKNEGITPGLRIRDAAGRIYLLKFDPPSNPEMASAADVIGSKFFYALGYNVPENYIVRFDRGRLAIGEGATFRDETGHKRPIRERDIDAMLAKVPRSKDGTFRALASLLISGKPLGPFRYDGTRSDDPNDLVPHEHRRDLRGLRTFSAWLGHDDSKALNSLDMLVTEDGVPFIKHYLIDFGATLGSASIAAKSPRDGNVYLFDWKSSAAQIFTLGLHVPDWQRARYPDLPAAGRFEYEKFDPLQWVGHYPNAAFRNENAVDRLWAARKVAAFTEADIRAIVATGEYSDPASEEWVVRCLIERRNKIASTMLTGIGALDHFEIRGSRLAFRGIDADSLVVRWSIFENRTGSWQHLRNERSWVLPRVDPAVEYIVATLSSGSGPSVSVFVSLKQAPKIVGIERNIVTAAARRTKTELGE